MADKVVFFSLKLCKIEGRVIKVDNVKADTHFGISVRLKLRGGIKAETQIH